MKQLLLIGLPFFCLAASVHAQKNLTGKVYDKKTDSALPGINILNTSSKATARSDHEGRYSIAANEGDKVVFSAAGLMPDTVIVTFSMLLTQYDPEMDVFFVSLKPVKVISSYKADSLERRNYYRKTFDSLKGITGGNRPTDGVGVSLSPLSFFSQKAKAARRLKKRLLNEEKESYIDHSFPAEWVKNLTGLKDDSLRLFMYRYRPSYDFCRKADRQKMTVYISDSLKEFRKPKS